MDALDLLAGDAQIPQSSLAKLAQLQRVTSALSEAITPRDVAAVIVRQGFTTLSASRGFVGVLAEDDSALEVIAGACHEGEEAARQRIPMSLAHPINDAIRTATAIFLGSGNELKARYPDLGSLDGGGEHALAALPLCVRGRVFGAMGLVFDHARQFDVEECKHVLTVSRQCALALDRARLYEAAAHARAEAEAANRAKDELLGAVSHRLRTSLTSILGWSALLREECQDARSARAIAVIERNSLALAQLADELLELDRMGPCEIDLSFSRRRLEGVRVLAVDDDEDGRDMVATLLRAHGAHTRVSASAMEAVQAFQEEEPDVLISDISMPHEDGYTLLRRLREVAPVRALALTAHASPSDAKMATQAGFERHLAKPFSPAQLVDTVAMLAGR